MANKTLFEEIVKSAESSPKHRWHLGGNAPAMVLRLAKEGLDVMLSARLTQDIVDRLPKEVKGTVILFYWFVIAIIFCYYYLNCSFSSALLFLFTHIWKNIENCMFML